MNYLLTVLLTITTLTLVSGQYTEIYEKLVRPHAEMCAESVGASSDDVNTVSKHEKLSTETLACLQYCVYHHLSLMDKLVLASQEDLVAIYKEVHAENPAKLEHAEENVKQCTDAGQAVVDQMDPCLFAQTIQECFRTQQ
ncbi:general odorant-binding protein 19d [Anabrus simplex]|uniref:general odorant-binding protein 19d n=1 Tax=Anabrus simplex TaxID=316456 RepID=UPI0035A33BBF